MDTRTTPSHLRSPLVAHERIQQVFRRLSDSVASYDGTTHEIRGDALVGRAAVG
jgi:hypothetical protein